MRFEDYKLGEISTFKYGKMPKKDRIKVKGYPIYTGYKVSGYYDEYMYEAEQLIVVARGVGGTGDVKLAPEKSYITNLSIIVELDKKKADKTYMMYYLNSLKLRYLDTGSAQSQITIKDLTNLKVRIPCLKEQKKVAQTLNKLFEKIELNNSIIANLEELAQTLFKHWFVDFEFPNEEGKPYKSSGGKMVESELGMIPEGWGVTNIQSMPVIISDHVANGSFASIKKNVQIVEDEDYALFLRNTDLKQDLQGERRYVTKSSYDFLKKTQLFGGEVIISNVGDVGTIHRCPSLNRPMVLGNNLIVIQPTEQNEVLNTYFYFLFKSFEGKKLIKSITSGSVQMKFNKTDFRNLKIVIPESFEKMNMNILKKILLKVDLLKQEIESLSNLRDTLLPKLLSGEIELPDDMEVTEDVPIS